MAAGMFEQSIISKLLEGGGLEVLHANGVTPEMFLTCGSEISFILKHYEQYKQVPDTAKSFWADGVYSTDYTREILARADEIRQAIEQ